MLFTEVINHWWSVFMTAQDKEYPPVCSASTFKTCGRLEGKTSADMREQKRKSTLFNSVIIFVKGKACQFTYNNMLLCPYIGKNSGTSGRIVVVQ